MSSTEQRATPSPNESDAYKVVLESWVTLQTSFEELSPRIA